MFGSFERHSVEETFNTLTSGKVDGLVILPTPINPIIEELRNSHLPVVAIANAVAGIPSVVVDDDAGSQILVEYLNRLGHRHVVYHADPRGHVSTIRRQIAFTQAAEALDIAVTIVPARFDHFLSGEELTLLRAENGIRPTAIVAWADYHAFMLMEACLQKGFRIPDDIAIVGFNGIQIDIRPTLELTTIRAPWQQVAATAVDVLMRLINGEEVPEETVLPVEFVQGDTA
jgi:DNA-binding LacI/PurR family transcriptional regulator